MRQGTLRLRGIAVSLVISILISIPGPRTAQAIGMATRGAAKALSGARPVGFKVPAATNLGLAPLTTLNVNLSPLSATVLHQAPNAAILSPAVAATSVHAPTLPAAQIRTQKITAKSVAAQTNAQAAQGRTPTLTESRKLETIAKRASALTDAIKTAAPGQLKSQAAFDGGRHHAQGQAVPVGGAFARMHSQLAHAHPNTVANTPEDPTPAAPKPSQKKGPTARGSMLWGMGLGLRAGLFSWLGIEFLNGALGIGSFSIATTATWAAYPIFALAGVSAIVGLGYAVIGLRIAGALKRKYKKEDALDESPSAWGTAIATQDGPEPGFEELPEHVAKVVTVHAQARKKGWGPFRSYLRQAAKFHIPFLLADAGYTLKRITRASAEGLRLVRSMVSGDKKFRFAWLPHKKYFYGAAFFLFLDGFLSMGILWMLQPLLDAGIAAATEGIAGYFTQMLMYSAGFVVLLLAYAFTERQHTWLGGLATVLTVRDMRNAFRKHFTGLDMGFHSVNQSGELSNRLRDDTVRLANKEVHVRYVLPHYVSVVVMSAATMFYLIPSVAPLVLLVALPIGILSGIFGQKIAGYSRLHQDLKADITAHSQEVYENANVMKSFAATEFEAKRYDAKADKVKRLDTRIALLWAKYMSLNGAFSELFTRFLVFGIGAWLIAAATGMTFGTVTAFAGFAYMMTYGFSGMASNFLKFSADDGATTRIREIWDQRSDIAEPTKPADIGTGLRGRIKFDDVTFAYDERDGSGKKMAPVLRDLSFTIEPGQTVAFVGETASGKSTVTNLLMRFWDPDQGQVSIDGIDLKALKSDDLRRSISMVLQDNRLFNETIRFNVGYGVKQASDEDIEAALRMAQADFVFDTRLFPDGLDTVVGEGGGNLSGGQRQRIAIARALIRRAPIMIFDEATAALDNESEREVQAAIQKLLDEGEAGGRTSIVIAHRLATIRNADNIFVLDKGQIAESGTWQELVAKKGAFYKMLKARSTTEPRAPPATAAGQYVAFWAATALAAGAAYAAWTLWLSWPALTLIPGTALTLPLAWAIFALVPIAIAASLAAFSFALTARAISRAVKAYREKQKAADDSLTFARSALFEPIATAESRSLAFANLDARYQALIDLHENAHYDRGVGEIRATLAQLRGLPTFLKAQIKAMRDGFREWRGLIKEFTLGDKVSKPFLQRYRGQIVLAAALMIFHAVITTWGAYYIGQILDAGVAAGAAKASADFLIPMLGWLVGALGLGALFQWIYLRIGGVVNAGIIADYRKALNRYFTSRKLKFFKKKGSGKLAAHVNGEDLEMLASKNVEIRIPLMTHGVTFVLASILMLKTAGPLGIGVYLLPFVLGWVNSIFGGKFEDALTRMVEARAQILSLGKESLALTKVVKAFNGEEKEDKRYGDKNLELTEIGTEVYKLQANQWMLESSLSDLFTKHLIYLAGAWLIAYGAGLSAGGIIATTLAAAYIKTSVQGISKSWIAFKQKRGGTSWVREQFTNMQEEEAARAQSPEQGEPLGEIKGSIEFENVRFRYDDDAEAPVILDGINLQITPGETVAFVGTSGSGKSTALHLVQKLYEPEAGRVLIDGRDIAELDGDELNRQIALVPQEPPLFNDSIRYNLTYGNTATDEQLAEAIRKADAQFIYDLPQGLDTRVGEAGDMFSGGQKQRIAIARAILRNAKILLLDEATSALDGATEARIQRALRETSSGNPTMLLVAHNLNTVKSADRIVVMDQGQIVEVGPHDELLAKRGRYYDLWQANKGGGNKK